MTDDWTELNWGHSSDLLKLKKSSKSTIGVLERYFRSPALGSRVKVTSNCHISGSTTISRIMSYFSQIFSANNWVWQECQCWPMLMWTSLVDKSGLGTPFLAEIFLELYCSLSLHLHLSFLPLSLQRCQNCTVVKRLFLPTPASSLLFFESVSSSQLLKDWSHLGVCFSDDLNKYNDFKDYN